MSKIKNKQKKQQHEISYPYLVTLSLAPHFNQTEGKRSVSKMWIYYSEEVKQDNN